MTAIFDEAIATVMTTVTTIDDQTNDNSIVVYDASDNDAIWNHVQGIVKATTTPIAAQRVLTMLEKELKKVFGCSDSDDDNDGNDDDDDTEMDQDAIDDEKLDDEDTDDATATVQGTLKVHRHKKNEIEKWKDLLVCYFNLLR
jgi:hypothetical protein